MVSIRHRIAGPEAGLLDFAPITLVAATPYLRAVNPGVESSRAVYDFVLPTPAG